MLIDKIPKDVSLEAVENNKITINSQKYKLWMLNLARASSLVFFYGTIASMAAANIGMALTLFFWLLSGVWMSRRSDARQSPIFLPIAVLMAATLFSLIYTSAPISYAPRYLLVYGKLFFILVLLTLHDDEWWLEKIFLAISIAFAVVLAATYANIFLNVPWANEPGGFGSNNSVFYDYIAQGIMSACAAVVAWILMFRCEKKLIRNAAAIAFLCLAFSILFLLPSRTGQLALLFSLIVVSGVLFERRQFLIFLVIGGLFAIGALALSPVLVSKMSSILSEGHAFFQQGVELSSVGARLSMWVNSLIFIGDSPILGHGVGSYRYLAERAYADPVMCSISCVHPHNQLLFFMVEYGLVGLLIFILFIRAFYSVAMFWKSRDLSVFAIVVGVCAIFLADCFINSPLWISSLRNFYIAVFSVIFIHYSIARKRLAMNG